MSDRDEALVGPDMTPPTAPGTLVATGGSAQTSLTWGAATDEVGVARYNVHRSTTAGFTPDAGNRIAQPTDTSYVDSPLQTGTYYYRVTAQDAAGNVGPASNQASATVTGDTISPQVSITSPAAGHRERADHRHRECERQPRRRGCPVQARRAEPRRGGHHGALLRRLGHARGAQRHPRAHCRRTRRRREHGHVEPGDRHRVERRRLHGRSPRGVRPGRGQRDDSGRLIGQPQFGDARGRRGLVDERPLRRRRDVERDDERDRPAGARDLLQDGVHARGVGAQAVDQGGCRRGRLLGRRPGRRRDDLGRPPLGSLPAGSGHEPRELCRLGPDADRRPVAARRGDVRRHHGALLRRRRRDRLCALRRQRR